MGTRIVLLSDGTGNAASKVWRTNVWRVFESLDLRGTEQVANYDDGVGTSSFKPLAILGGAFGYGLKRNVLDLYKFACRNYRSDQDEIFGFGFSRGAFTVRVVVGLILNQGLVKFQSEAELNQKARLAYRAYRSERFHSRTRIENLFRGLRNLFSSLSYNKANNRQVHNIRFLGVWDSVAAYGMPVDEMTRGFSQWIWPLELPDRCLDKRVTRACHALALDDERTTFHPLLWDELGETRPQPDAEGNLCTKDERISQVWFVGAHSNVGGGYPDDSLAHIPLYWMITEAAQCGLKLKIEPDADPDSLVHTKAMRDKDGRRYDPRAGLGGYYRYGPRKLQDLCNMVLSNKPSDAVRIATPKIHESVFKRIRENVHLYAPIGISDNYEVVTDDGHILSANKHKYESSAQAKTRAQLQERIWNIVWGRRIVYFATVLATSYLLIYPLIRTLPHSDEYETWFRPLSDLIRLFGAFLPGAFDTWFNAYARDPVHFFVAASFVATLIGVGSSLAARIIDQMRALWSLQPPQSSQRLHDSLYRWRTSAPYQGMLRWWKWYVGPALLVVALIYYSLALFSHLAFNFQDSLGLICSDGSSRDLTPGERVELRFSTSALCVNSGVRVEEKGKYRITATVLTPWADGSIPTGTKGFYTSDLDALTGVRMFLATPLRRAYFRPWFRLIARYGSTGGEEEFLDPDQRGSVDQTLDETIRARRDGQLFFYVNDAVLGIPCLWSLFYHNNSGEALITIERVGN